VIRGLRFGACSDVGLVREVNEDSKLHEPPLFAVADGMGGHSAGDVASAMAIELVQREMGHADFSLTAAVKNANKAIYQKASDDPDLAGMGTTITAMYLTDASAKIVHVGDSRAYLLRGGELSRITQDHTVVGRLVQQGRISPQDADRHPQRSYLERALGVDPDVEVDVHVLELFPGDRILLCSDGLFGMIDDSQILSAMKGEADPQRAAEALCRQAVDAGGTDNVTAVIVDYPDSPTETYLPPITASGTPPAPSSARPSSRDTGPLDGGGSFAPRQDPRTVAIPPGVRSEPRRSDDARRRSRSRNRTVLLAGLAIVLLGVAAWSVRTSIKTSWYVGADGGKVTIFNGIKGSVGGMEFSEVERRTEIDTHSLPELYQRRVGEGIEARDLNDAASIVEDLEKLATPEPATAPTAPEAPAPAIPAP
jgi:serine/threonine protein phosphatase PrpC